MYSSPTLIIDGHCDTLSKIYNNNLDFDNNDLMFKINEASNFNSYIQFLATFISPSKIKDINDGYVLGNKILDKFYFEYNNNYNDKFILLDNKNTLDSFLKNNVNKRIGIVLTSENGSIIGNNLNNIYNLHSRGIKIMSLTWNNDNLLGCGANTKNDTGLTFLAKNV